MAFLIIGVNAGEGVKVYHNGQFIAEDSLPASRNYDISSVGHLAIGRLLLHNDGQYTSVDVDELLIFDAVLSDQEVMDIYNLY